LIRPNRYGGKRVTRSATWILHGDSLDMIEIRY
jgi:hypothetical protein